MATEQKPWPHTVPLVRETQLKPWPLNKLKPWQQSTSTTAEAMELAAAPQPSLPKRKCLGPEDRQTVGLLGLSKLKEAYEQEFVSDSTPFSY